MNPVYNACISVVFSFLLRPSSFLQKASGLFSAAFAALLSAWRSPPM